MGRSWPFKGEIIKMIDIKSQNRINEFIKNLSEEEQISFFIMLGSSLMEKNYDISNFYDKIVAQNYYKYLEKEKHEIKH